MIVDANIILQAFFPDEVQPKAQALIRDHVSGRVQLSAHTLLMYEVTNAVLQAVRRERVTDEDAKAILVRGPTVEALLAMAEKQGADLIIVGSHGRGVIAGMLLGSVSQGLIRARRWPVTVVPVSDQEE